MFNEELIFTLLFSPVFPGRGARKAVPPAWTQQVVQLHRSNSQTERESHPGPERASEEQRRGRSDSADDGHRLPFQRPHPAARLEQIESSDANVPQPNVVETDGAQSSGPNKTVH